MDSGGYSLRWDDNLRGRNGGIISEEIISDIDSVQSHYSIDPNSSHLNNEIIPDTDQIAAENLIFLAQDIVGQIGNYVEPVQQFNSDAFTVEQVEIDNAGEIECQVTEEVITDDWVQPGGQERVDVSLEQLSLPNIEQQHEGHDVDFSLPTDQDQYTAMRPYPCDFCSRRFRKKANLMNHMVAHQNDRPFGCNLCGARYVRRCDLLNHLKVHAFVPEDAEEETVITTDEAVVKRKSRKRSAQYSISDKSSTYSDKTSVAARTQQYEGSGSSSTNLLNNRINFEATDPSRPFVCQHCGVGFAREKALASHARVHGSDSPIECNICGELCYSKENLITHTHSRHPNRAPQALPMYEEENSSEESAVEDRRHDSWVELICKDCGAGFQRADLLHKHARAAHNYMYMKKESENDNKSVPEADEENVEETEENWVSLNHACSVCGEGFKDALELLAHAESHARGRNNRCVSCGEKFTDNAKMAEHISTNHPDLPPNICLFCGRLCSDERTLAKHIASQHDGQGKTLFCSKCGKSFHNKARLKRHMASHRDKAVTCDVCGDSFADGRSLMNHRHSHKTNSGRKFPCHECGKTFGSRSSQQIHIRIHTGERPYGCRFCWKAFADGGTLRKHERIHTGEKPYACAICPRAFNQRVVLREHVRSHHSGPNSHHGVGSTPYWCPVCDRLMATSVELVHHIIQHCDNNTAMKRQPQSGPRKYKRRRKLNTDTKAGSPSENKNDTEGSVSEGEVVVIPIRKLHPSRRAKEDESPNYQLDDSNEVSVQNTSSSRSGESSVGGSARTKGKLKTKRTVEVQRPKMIHTERTKPEDTAVVTRRKGRSNYTIVTSTTSTVTTTVDERIRPRTKNVSYHDNVERLPTATFPSSVKAEPENDIAADLRAIYRDPMTIDDDLEEPSSHQRNVKCEPFEERVVSQVSLSYIKEESEEGANSSEDGPFRCEMCSEAFDVRRQLLAHVRVHI